MICKYCKDENHIIDNCPLIVCRLCNTKGHVDWKCPKHKDKRKNKPKKKKSTNSAVINLTEFPKLKINTKSSSINNAINKEINNENNLIEKKKENIIDYSNMSWVEINKLVY